MYLVEAEIEVTDNTFEVEFDGAIEIIDGDPSPPYEGSYEVTPTLDAQTLATKNKSMKNDFTINAIPLSRVANPAGGDTVTIG